MIYDENLQELMKCLDSLRILDEINFINSNLETLNSNLNEIPKLINGKEFRIYQLNDIDKESAIRKCQNEICKQIKYLEKYKEGLFNGIKIIQKNSY